MAWHAKGEHAREVHAGYTGWDPLPIQADRATAARLWSEKSMSGCLVWLIAMLVILFGGVGILLPLANVLYHGDGIPSSWSNVLWWIMFVVPVVLAFGWPFLRAHMVPEGLVAADLQLTGLPLVASRDLYDSDGDWSPDTVDYAVFPTGFSGRFRLLAYTAEETFGTVTLEVANDQVRVTDVTWEQGGPGTGGDASAPLERDRHFAHDSMRDSDGCEFRYFLGHYVRLG